MIKENKRMIERTQPLLTALAEKEEESQFGVRRVSLKI
jgi:hypothetical protein